ncbi:hypothetical protein EPA93_02265 [Ktedonosporobacter rubrisoli]|uniref:Uncharacterized protein n=1 Tax=Ktedonosporobacter rubrisoli TaxID=2509675 RepID=A0A4P6JIJ0_KTERU|nr:hypothetical protein [Ktedonosporobacter rubrisoli]QBD74879.1 hypothetical protein EPA93_02265 [Ktedonosporobacter rubrisoli]
MQRLLAFILFSIGMLISLLLPIVVWQSLHTTVPGIDQSKSQIVQSEPRYIPTPPGYCQACQTAQQPAPWIKIP